MYNYLQPHDLVALLMLGGFVWAAYKFMQLLKEIRQTTKEIHAAMYRMLRILDIELREEEGQTEH